MASIFDQALDILGSIAPTVATALGGPLAGQAVQFIEKQLGIAPAPDATMDDRKAVVAAAVVNATPEQMIELRKVETAFQAHLADLGVELEKIAAGDRASARQMQIETHDWTPRILALALVSGFFSVLLWMLYRGIPPNGGEALLVMLGALGAAFGAVCNYYFGSSAGSASKDKVISAAALTPR